MAKPHIFEDLEAWKLARELTNEIYRLCREAPLNRDFSLCDQIRRAALSSMNNITEGWKTLHRAEKRQFCNWAPRSCGDVRSMTYVLDDNSLVPNDKAIEIRNRCIQTGRLISDLIRSVKSESA